MYICVVCVFGRCCYKVTTPRPHHRIDTGIDALYLHCGCRFSCVWCVSQNGRHDNKHYTWLEVVCVTNFWNVLKLVLHVSKDNVLLMAV